MEAIFLVNIYIFVVYIFLILRKSFAQSIYFLLWAPSTKIRQWIIVLTLSKGCLYYNVHIRAQETLVVFALGRT